MEKKQKNINVFKSKAINRISDLSSKRSKVRHPLKENCGSEIKLKILGRILRI